MPLLIDNNLLEEVPASTKSLIERYTSLKVAADTLVAQMPKVVGPEGLLYVQQKEFAVITDQNKNISVLGADDATTCHLVILRNAGSGAVGIGHFDGYDLDRGILSMIQKTQDLGSMGLSDARLELHLVGGFLDDRCLSEELSLQLLDAFHNQPVQVHLVTACIGELNNRIQDNINWTIIYGVGVNVKSGEVFPATFLDRSPDAILRSCRVFTTCSEMLDVYDSHTGRLTIGPYDYEPYPDAEFWLTQSALKIRWYLSTSPEVEPPHFVAHIRASMQFLQQNPYPSLTVFPEGKPHCFEMDENGIWVPVS